MTKQAISLLPPLKGIATVPGDKSIAHRALMVQLLFPPHAQRTIDHVPPNADVLATLDCIKQLGIQVDYLPNTQQVTLTNPVDWPRQSVALDAKNSGTTLRLMSGLLSGLNISAQITGDHSLQKRPMQRILMPLHQMGAHIESTHQPEQQTAVAPLTLHARSDNASLTAITYTLPVASAQVKSAILLAGLWSQGTTTVIEPTPTRDHTERMLKALGIPIQMGDHPDGTIISITGPIAPEALHPVSMTIPGDVSSAVFLLALAAITPGSHLDLKHIGLNPGRIGALNVLKQWGALLQISNRSDSYGEPIGDIEITHHPLSGDVTLGSQEIPGLVDELPILAITAAFVDGTFIVHGAEELRHKECDRLDAIHTVFKTLSLPITMHPDGFTITGKTHPVVQYPPSDLTLPTFHDHRIGLCWHVLNHRLDPHNTWALDHPDCIGVSFPNFPHVLSSLTQTKDPLP